MKKAIALLTLPIILVACGTRTVVIEKEVDRATQETIQLPEVTDPPAREKSSEEIFIEGVLYDWPNVVNEMGKSYLIKLGYTFCGAIDEGMSFNELVEITIQANVDGGIVGSVLREAVDNFCPENKWFIDSALRGNA